MKLTSVVFGVALIGCGGGRERTWDAALGRDADASPSDADASADADVDVDASNDADADAALKPLPVASASSRRVVPGAAFLVGHGLDSCTNAPAGGDRWCGFARSAAGDTGFTELWVIDATKAAAGAAIACDGTDASCLRLSTRLLNSQANGVSDSGFNGDTLIFGEVMYSSDSTGPFVGVLSAWRPGWAAARVLTSARGLFCVGQASSDAALCFEDANGDGMFTDLTVDLHAGHLSSATGPVLPKIDTLLLAATTDPVGASPRYQFDLSPDGDVVWSTRGTPDDVEVLHAQTLAGGSPPLVVARDVSQWALSPDGLAWYWLAGYNYDVAGAPAGTLQTAAFPDGSSPTTLATAVGDFAVVGARSLWFRSDVAEQVGTLRWMADRAAPDAVATVDAKVLAVLDHTRDGARFLYAKTYAPVRPGPVATVSVGMDLVDLYIGSVTGDAPCVPAATPTALHATLAPSGSVAVWDAYDVLTADAQGFATTVSSCASASFATRLGGVLPAADEAGNEGYVYLEDTDEAAREATLRYARVVNGALVVGTPIQTRAALVFAPLQPAVPAVLYTVATATPADGLYVARVLAADADASTDMDASTDAGTSTAPEPSPTSDAGAAS
jgi:hypothetical protein